ncbi:GmrSD restriction endonuclease domain-containing protein [Nocardia cyriacigeorgica]|uniref:GmrSD restriction endonuclease domain-containing protein n=1 Tax=Nocardia cyriacigeorgica TaxID=135487 RepID=UPI002457FDA1|nr:DUF1524 domain-containing protein [Nocardia cyriacigeorgica]
MNNQPPRPGKKLGWKSWTAIGVGGSFFGLVALGAAVGEQETDTASATSTIAPASTSSAAPISTGVPAVPASEASAPAATPVQQTAPGDALATLEGLPVKGRAPKTGYEREQFGQAWSDDVTVEFGHNGCDTRNDILDRDLTNKTYKPGTGDCVVLTGTLNDPYTGRVIAFRRGEDTSNDVQIDHVVALSDAWQKGAQQLTPEERQAFANDPRNLLAVDGPTNSQKSDSDAASWLPPNKAFRCTYVSMQIEVKATYRLWVTQAEKDAMARVLGNCGGGEQPVVAPTTTTSELPPPPPPAPEPSPEPPPAPPVAPPPPAPSNVYYKNCSEARAAGAAPIYAGEPGYRAGLDRNSDGVACE